MDYPKLISEKWNLTAKFNCLQAIYLYAPSALSVPMCASRVGVWVEAVRIDVRDRSIISRQNPHKVKGDRSIGLGRPMIDRSSIITLVIKRRNKTV